MRLTQNQIVQLNDRYREYSVSHTNPKSFLDFRRDYIKELKRKEIERIKKEYQKNGRKIRSLENQGKVVKIL